MLTDEENRPALAIMLVLHALLMAILTGFAVFEPVSASGALAAMATVLIYIMAQIAGLAWIAQMPLVRSLCDHPSQLQQAAGCLLFLVGLCAVAFGITASWILVPPWAYPLFTGACGLAAFVQFRRMARESRLQAAGLPVATLVSR